MLHHARLSMPRLDRAVSDPFMKKTAYIFDGGGVNDVGAVDRRRSC